MVRRHKYEDDDDDYRRVEPHRGQTVLILGVVALAFMHLIGPFVWWMGAVDLRKMQEGRMDRRGESDTRIGYVLGIISTVLVAIGLLCALLICAMFVFGFGLFAIAAAGR